MANFNTDFNTPSEYTYDPEIEVTGGLAKLKKENLWNNLISYWRMDETSGQITDISGNEHHGINYGATYGVPGLINNALSFDATNNNEYININNNINASLSNLTNFSLNIWFKQSNTNDRADISISTKNTNQNRLRFIILNTKIYFVVEKDNGVSYGWKDSINNTPNVWVHVVCVFNGNGVGNGERLKIYVNGQQQVLTFSGTVPNSTHNYTSTDEFNIGKAIIDSSTFNYATCIYDEIGCWDRTLTQDDINELYNAGNGKYIQKYNNGTFTIVKTLGDSDTISIFNSFVVTQGTTTGAATYQLSTDGTNWKYWDGSSWATATISNSNSEATINTNISSFPTTANKIYVKTFMTSDGMQSVEIDEINISYVSNTNPLVDSGVDKSVVNGNTLAPFSDATFSDDDGTVVQAHYKIDGEVDTWTEILQGGYGTLLEAVQAFSYQFNNLGSKNIQLQVTDNLGGTQIDTLSVNVLPYYITFNVRDDDGNHLTGVTFTADDGTATQTVDSPFVHGYVSGTYSPIFEHPPHTTYVEENIVVNDDATINVTLFELTPDAIASSVWKKLESTDWGNESMGNLVIDTNTKVTENTIDITLIKKWVGWLKGLL